MVHRRSLAKGRFGDEVGRLDDESKQLDVETESGTKLWEEAGQLWGVSLVGWTDGPSSSDTLMMEVGSGQG